MADDYTVTSQRQTTTIGDDGRVTPVMEVRFRTKPEGVHASVDVPLDQYDADHVHELISGRVATLKAVHYR